jgi:hypothetical protein
MIRECWPRSLACCGLSEEWREIARPQLCLLSFACCLSPELGRDFIYNAPDRF